MESEIIAAAVEGGIWIMLFVALLWYVLDDSKKREAKYQEVIISNQLIIKELTKKLSIVEDIEKNVCEIRERLN